MRRLLPRTRARGRPDSNFDRFIPTPPAALKPVEAGAYSSLRWRRFREERQRCGLREKARGRDAASESSRPVVVIEEARCYGAVHGRVDSSS